MQALLGMHESQVTLMSSMTVRTADLLLARPESVSATRFSQHHTARKRLTLAPTLPGHSTQATKSVLDRSVTTTQLYGHEQVHKEHQPLYQTNNFTNTVK
jgi:hypothetical protein